MIGRMKNLTKTVVIALAMSCGMAYAGKEGKVVSGSVSGNVLTLQLEEAVQATTITYLDELSWSQDRLLVGENGIAALTFCNVLISGRRKTK